mmetsp:Transcript_122727/g.382088  ORF Transcript_122727/g.382088 Transcript_122727/m.382088 type:complete len:204 (+) Transcript_122727:589-1200(+)
MASSKNLPFMWPSTQSRSNGEMPALRTAATMHSCSPGPDGVASVAILPLVFIMAPGIVPMNSSLSFWMTLPSITDVAPFKPTAAQPSPRMYPSAEALKLWQRPVAEYQPSMQWFGHHMGASKMWTPTATAKSLETARPFFWTDSAAMYVADKPEAASVVKVMAGPFIPRQKEKRPEYMQRAPVTPPKPCLPVWKAHSSVPHPT